MTSTEPHNSSRAAPVAEALPSDSDTLSRRNLITAVGAATAAGFGSAVGATAPPVAFTHGVASGDPLQTAVVLWTRAAPTEPGSIDVEWEVAETEDFAFVTHRGITGTDQYRDYTVKVDVTGLAPGHVYYYRFRAGDALSPVGRTRTFPASGTRPFKLAVMCCASIGSGFFNVYRHCADRDDIDVVLQIGDYIYEYATWEMTPEEQAKGMRRAMPVHEIVTVADYRLRYGSHRLDPDLQEIHRRHPMIPIWDDHEIANNAYATGAENHNLSEGPWEMRKAAAVQAYFEWMPVRPLVPDTKGRLFRSFDVGDVASIIMIDTRLYGREKVPGLESEFMRYLSLDADSGGWPIPFDATQDPPVAKRELAADVQGDPERLPPGYVFIPDYNRFTAEVLAGERTIMGPEQEAWLSETLKASKARGLPWQILGQQTIVATMTLVDRTPYLRSPADNVRFSQGPALPDQTRPFALDTFGGGYHRARQRLLTVLRENANNTIIFSGDLHNAWGFKHFDEDGVTLRAVEVTTASTTQPGMESFLGTQPIPYARAMMERNPHLIYAELGSRGYAVLNVASEAVTVEWMFVDTIKSKKFTGRVGKRLTIAANSGAGPMQIVES